MGLILSVVTVAVVGKLVASFVKAICDSQDSTGE